MERTWTRSSTVSLTVWPHWTHSASSQTSSSLWFALTRNRPWVRYSVEGQVRQRRRMAGRPAGRTSHCVVAHPGNVLSCTREGRSAARSSLRQRRGADGRGAGSISGCHVAGSRTSMTCRGHAKAGRQRNGATRLGARQGAACLPGAMNVSAGVQRPVLDRAGGNAGRRIPGDDVTVAPAAHATPPNYPGDVSLAFSRSIACPATYADSGSHSPVHGDHRLVLSVSGRRF